MTRPGSTRPSSIRARRSSRRSIVSTGIAVARLALAADDAMRLKVFENAVDEVISYRWHGLVVHRADAFAALQDIAQTRGSDPD